MWRRAEIDQLPSQHVELGPAPVQPLEMRQMRMEIEGGDAFHQAVTIELAIAGEFDRYRLMEGVTTFNLHPHLPHFERLNGSRAKLDVLARQLIDLGAPPHSFAAGGRVDFDALLQTKSGVFP